jgi:GH24 family phage-related lysozyme (muramidase)
MNVQQVMARLESFEGSVPYMYRCTGGAVTAGIGHAIDDVAAAASLNWEVAGRQALAAEVAADFEKVAAAPKGMLAAHYQGSTQCRLPGGYLTLLAQQDIANVEAGLVRDLPNWPSYPETAQEALFDMAFNLGIAGLRKFPKLLAAVESGDWETAATQSFRQGVSEERNREIAALFLQARAPAPEA